jgi:hypothetical protein
MASTTTSADRRLGVGPGEAGARRGRGGCRVLGSREATVTSVPCTSEGGGERSTDVARSDNRDVHFVPSHLLDELADIHQSLLSATLNDECSACQYLFGEAKT